MPDTTTNLKDAKARLSELVDRAQSGETITISRRGRVVAQLTPSTAVRQAVNIQALRELTRRLPRAEQDAGQLMRELRDEARY